MVPNLFNCPRPYRNPDASSLSLIPDINSNYGNLINVIGVDWGHWTGTVDSLSNYKNSLIAARKQIIFSLSSVQSVRSEAQLDPSRSSVARLGSLPDWVDTITKASMLPTHSHKRRFGKNPDNSKNSDVKIIAKKANQSMQTKAPIESNVINSDSYLVSKIFWSG